MLLKDVFLFIKITPYFIDIIDEGHMPLTRRVLRVLYEVLEHYHWHGIDKDLTSRLLNMFHATVCEEEENESIKKGLEMCIRRIMDNLDGHDLVAMVVINKLFKHILVTVSFFRLKKC